MYRVAHKKWTISFCCLNHVYHTHNENFHNVSTVVLKTLIKMLFSMSTLRWNNWSQLFPKLSDFIANQLNPSNFNMIMTYLTWTILQRMLILISSPNPVSGIYILQEWNHCWANNLRKLCSQIARWSTFLCVAV